MQGPASTLLLTKGSCCRYYLPLHHPGWRQQAKSSKGRGRAPGSLHLFELGKQRPVWEWGTGLTALGQWCCLGTALRGWCPHQCQRCWAVPGFTTASSDGKLGGDQSRVGRSGYTVAGHLLGCLQRLKLSEGGLFPLAGGYHSSLTSEGSCSCKGHTG